jgi:hypothetical protein
MKKHLSMPGMQSALRNAFNKVTDLRAKSGISLTDCLSSGLAVFSLKYPSLLQYDKEREAYGNNLKSLFQIEAAPSDTYLRERLDDVDPRELRPCFKKLFSMVQRGKYLEGYIHHEGRYLVSIDGTGYFSSKNVHCDQCCIKKHKDGTTTYYHQVLAAALVHPNLKQVIPFAPEPISKQDGATKNDCERNAAKRLLSDLRREHPHLSLTVVEDALYANAPHLELLKTLDMRYIIGVKPKDHTWLFDYVEHEGCDTHSLLDGQGYLHEFRFVNDAPLNESHESTRVNFLEYTETSPKGTKKHFTWITDFKLTIKTVYNIMRGGRARWKIENETFNTLKNQGYQFEHNFGHGYKNLSHVFANLMILAFFVDQIQAMACPLFRAALKKQKSLKSLWRRVIAIFQGFLIESWDSLYDGIANWQGPIVKFNTS